MIEDCRDQLSNSGDGLWDGCGGLTQSDAVRLNVVESIRPFFWMVRVREGNVWILKNHSLFFSGARKYMLTIITKNAMENPR